MTYRAIALFVAATMLSAPALAQSQSQDKASVAALKQRYAEVYMQRTVGKKLGAYDYQMLNKQQAEVDALIRRMEAGETVSVQEMDRVLGTTQERPAQ